MHINIEILSGPRNGEEFKLQSGATIGRRAADLTIKDAKMSSQHAQIESKEGAVYLVDLGSRNKIQVGEKNLEELELTEGCEFTLGSTLFRVKIPKEEESQPILDFLKELEKNSSNEAKEVYPFSSKIVAKFLAGPDRGKEIPLSYGPRSAGKDSVDIKLSESFEREELFYIEEREKILYLCSKDPDHLLVNGKAAKADNKIEDGTELQFANTKILFRLS